MKESDAREEHAAGEPTGFVFLARVEGAHDDAAVRRQNHLAWLMIEQHVGQLVGDVRRPPPG
jgi:hypothetical protein